MKFIRYYLAVSILSFSVYSSAQFETIDSLEMDVPFSNWNVDKLGYLYIVNENQIEKIDTNKQIVFRQSIKSIGTINQIEFINAQNILLFSVEQQQISLLDNTLTSNGYNIALEDYGIMNALHISSSSRPNLIWIYDQFNSKIILFDLYRKIIVQEVSNFKGLNGIKSEIIYFQELENNLIIQSDKFIFILDMNINLINKVVKQAGTKAFLNGNILLHFEKSKVRFSNLISDDQGEFPLPFKNIEKAHFANNHLYIGVNRKIYKISIK